MLTADLVRVRKDQRTRELRLNCLADNDKARARAMELATVLLDIVKAHVGKEREELEEALSAVTSSPRERLIFEGLKKLIEDRCEFDVSADVPPEELRGQVFLRAAQERRAKGAGFFRDEILEEIGKERGLTKEQVEKALYADLKSAHLLTRLAPVTAIELVDGYDLCQAQAVLLRAVSVRVDVRCATAYAYRMLFRKLKFLRLLFEITPKGQKGGYSLEISGPFSLFDSVTKYGLQLALMLPFLAQCLSFDLTADVRWGKGREPYIFRLAGGGDEGNRQVEMALPDEVETLVRGLRSLSSPWDIGTEPTILHLPGVSLCVPDLVFTHKESAAQVFLEVMGYWSRDAVWRRVELVEKGLAQPVLFAVSERLRVSEAALADDLPAALYVYKGVLSPKVVLDRVRILSERAKP